MNPDCDSSRSDLSCGRVHRRLLLPRRQCWSKPRGDAMSSWAALPNRQWPARALRTRLLRQLLPGGALCCLPSGILLRAGGSRSRWVLPPRTNMRWWTYSSSSSSVVFGRNGRSNYMTTNSQIRFVAFTFMLNSSWCVTLYLDIMCPLFWPIVDLQANVIIFAV